MKDGQKEQSPKLRGIGKCSLEQCEDPKTCCGGLVIARSNSLSDVSARYMNRNLVCVGRVVVEGLVNE